MVCGCCQAPDRTRSGCSCTGGKSHQCLKNPKPTSLSLTPQPTSLSLTPPPTSLSLTPPPTSLSLSTQPRTSAGTMYYVIGLPGSGKSTAVGDALGPYPYTAHAKPMKHCDYGFCTMFGHWRPVHPGTCTLAFNIHPVAMQFVVDKIAQEGTPILVAEGDRLSGNKFFDHVLSLGMDLKIIHFSIDPIISRARAVERGNIYNDSWYKGRVTKIRNTLQRYPSVSIDASQSAQQIALELKNLFDFLPSNVVFDLPMPRFASMPLPSASLASTLSVGHDLLGLFDTCDPVEIAVPDEPLEASGIDIGTHLAD